jgi:hypothetical protein
MHCKYYFSLISFWILTSSIAGTPGGPPPPGPPPPPPTSIGDGLIYLLIFGLFLAFFKLRSLKFQK